MGSGKGAPDHWVCVVRPGRVLFEIAGVREDIAKEAMRRAGHKLPIETRFITKESALEIAADMPGGSAPDLDEAGQAGAVSEMAGAGGAGGAEGRSE
jgi:hypothetical protein